MNKLCIILAVAMALASPALAAKGAGNSKSGKRAHKAALALAKFDADKNHQIDGDEVAKLKEAFAAAAANGKARGRIDANKNGVLDDEELAALNKRLAKHAGHKKGQGKKAG